MTINELFSRKPPLFRALMQNYGTEVRRGDDPEYWTKRWAAKVEMETRAGKNVVVDDCRFLNEAQAIKDAGGVIVRIERPDVKPESKHQSEAEMENIIVDRTIAVEAGDFDSLYEGLDLIVPAKEG